MTSFAHDNTELAETYDRVSDSQFESGKSRSRRVPVQSYGAVLLARRD